MKISLKRYEDAKKKLAKLKDCQQIVQTWESAVKQIGNVGNQRLVAIEIDTNGRMTTKFEVSSLKVAEQKGA